MRDASKSPPASATHAVERQSRLARQNRLRLLRGKVSSDAFWALLGTVTSILAGIAVTKIITLRVSALEYGKASLALGAVALMSAGLVLPTTTAHYRLYADYRERKQGKWFAQISDRGAALLGVLTVVCYAGVAAVSWRMGAPTMWWLTPAVGLLLIAQPYFSLTTNYLEAQRSQRTLALLNVLSRVLQLAWLPILLTLPLSGGASVVLSQAMPLFMLALWGRRFIVIPSCGDEAGKASYTALRPLLRELAALAWALPLANLAMWILSTGDRYLIQHFIGLAETGVYTINYGLWSMPFIALNGWLEGLTRPMIYAKAAKGDWLGVRKIAHLRAIAGVAMGMAGTGVMWCLRERISTLILTPRYFVTSSLMLMIALAHCIQVLGYSFLPIFLANKRTGYILLATSIGAVILVVTEVVLLPRIGILGAAAATLIGYACWGTILVTCGELTIRRLLADSRLDDAKSVGGANTELSAG